MRKMLEGLKTIKIKEYLFPLIIFNVIFAIGLAFDLVTKSIVSNALKYQEGVPQNFIGTFIRLTLTYNKGAAWSLGGGADWSRILLVILSWAVAIIIPLFLLYKLARHEKMNLLKWICAGLIWAGDIGNLIDRTFFYDRGVCDFLDITAWFPGFGIFNIADSCLVVGLFILIGILIYESIKEVATNKRKNNLVKETKSENIEDKESKETVETTEEK